MKINWQDNSIHRLVERFEPKYGSDPVTIIRLLTRDLVLHAFSNGWDGPPFDIIELAKMLDIEVNPNDNVSDGRILVNENGKFCIEYNPFQQVNRINFSLAHEIGHWLFPDCEEKTRYRDKDLDSNSWELEFLCNVAAAEILLPYGKFFTDANKAMLTIEGLTGLANKYKASLESVLIRFCEVVEQPCLVLITKFTQGKTLELIYTLKSNNFILENQQNNLVIPENSSVFECVKPGWTSYKLEEWESLGPGKFWVHSIGLPPIRKTIENRVGIFIIPEISNIENENCLYSVRGDATEPRGAGKKIIVQIVNTFAATGSGFGKAMAVKFPKSKEVLANWKSNKADFILGKSKLTQLEDDIWVFQIIAQEGIFSKYGQIPLKYDSLRVGLSELREHAKDLNATVHMPLIGAGQAKGNWDLIEEMIYQELVRNGVSVSIYILPGKKIEQTKSPLDLFSEVNGD